VVVDVGVAQIQADRVAPMGGLDAGKPVGNLAKGLVPADGFPPITGAPHGVSQPVRVLVDVLESQRLGADVAATEWVLVVTLDAGDGAVFNLDGDAAHGLAEVAGAVMGSVVHDSSPAIGCAPSHDCRDWVSVPQATS